MPVTLRPAFMLDALSFKWTRSGGILSDVIGCHFHLIRSRLVSCTETFVCEILSVCCKYAEFCECKSLLVAAVQMFYGNITPADSPVFSIIPARSSGENELLLFDAGTRARSGGGVPLGYL